MGSTCCPLNFGDTIRLQASTGDNILRVEIACFAFDSNFAVVGVNGAHFGVTDDLSAGFQNSLGQTAADFAVIDDARLGHMDGADAGGMRFEFRQASAIDQFAFDAVGLTALENAIERRQFGIAGGDNHFAADFVGDALGSTELLHGRFASAAIRWRRLPGR